MSASSSAAAAAAARSAFLRGLYRRPALLLVVTTLIWGSNAVAARLAVGHVSPMMLTTARWSIACIALWLVARQQVAQHVPALRGRWTYLALMGISGFTAFNALFYAAAHHTTAVNLSLIQGMIPVLVLLGGVMFFGLRVTALQMAGVVITLAGVAVVASRGSWAALAALDINVGDAWILLASLLYAGYTLGLRARPVVPPLVFFSAVAGVAALASLPLLGGVMFFGLRVTALQMAGVVITLAGVAVVASRGSWAALAALDINVGDAWILLASLLYAGYTLGLRARHAVPPLVFFSAVAGVAALASLPLLAAEVASGRFFWPTPWGWAILVHIGLLPSFVSQILFIRAVEMIGPARASVFLNLNPVFGPALAVGVLGEPVGWYHAVALAMVLGGIWIAERLGTRRPV